MSITRRTAFAGLSVPFLLAQATISAAESPDAELHPDLTMLKRLVGKWAGRGEGEPGVSDVERSYEPVLGGRFMMARNQSTYAPQDKNPKGELHQDMGLYSFDDAAKSVVFRQFHIEGFVNHYVAAADTLAGDVLTFLTTSIENIPSGYTARETTTFTGPDAFEERFEIAEPGKDFATYSTNKMVRA